jgi:uncharacterized protein (DUF885 family)
MRALSIFAVLILLVCSFVAQQPRSNENEATKQLYALFDSEWERGLKNSPVRSSLFGDLSQNDKWDDNSLAAIALRHRESIAGLEKLKKIDRSELSKKDKLNYDIFKKQYESST